MSSPIDPIWRIGLYERHVFRSNGRVGALCLECGEMFWENGIDEKRHMGRSLKKHVVTAHSQYGLKLLELMLQDEEEREAQESADRGPTARDSSTVSSTEHSHFAEAFHQSIVATEKVRSESAEEKGQLMKRICVPNSGGISNDEGTSTSTDCDGTPTPPTSADLWAATQQLCTSLYNNIEAAPDVSKMPNLELNLPTVPPLRPIVSEQFSIDLPELPERVFPVYVDEHSVRWHWLHAAKNEKQAIEGHEKQLLSDIESGKRLFFSCATDILCPFRAVWVRDRLAVYQSRGHATHSPPLSSQGAAIKTAPITANCSSPLLLSPQRPINNTSQIIADQSQIPIEALIGKAAPIVINLSGTASSAPVSAGNFSKSAKEEWKFLAHIAADESNLGSICSQWSIARQSIVKSNLGMPIRYLFGCVRRKAPFRCRFRAVFVRGQNSIFYRWAHNHSVPLSELEMEWLNEWNAQQKKKPKPKQQKKVPNKTLNFSSSLESLRQLVSDQQQSFTDSQNAQIVGTSSCSIGSQQNLENLQQQSSTPQNTNSPLAAECSSISALQKFLAYFDNRPSTSAPQQQQDTATGALLNSQPNGRTERDNGNGAISLIKQEHFGQ